MREVLFRGKTMYGRWVEGSLVVKTDSLYGFKMPCIVMQESGRNGILEPTLTWHAVKPETVGQFTGLKDRNGKRIYESDIVDCWSEGVNARGTVQQRKDGMWIIYPAWQKAIMWSLCPDEHCNTTVEVIGNIHDNPELPEEEK